MLLQNTVLAVLRAMNHPLGTRTCSFQYLARAAKEWAAQLASAWESRLFIHLASPSGLCLG